MTLIAGSLATTLALLLVTFVMSLGETSAAKGRAQLAADAAALAAVAESAPYGEGNPEDQAERTARANGARLLGCLCPVGGTAVQVRVAVDDVVAEARATIDPSSFFPLAAATRGDLHPVLDRAVKEILQASGGRVTVTSGWRSSERQIALWADAVQRYGDPEIADDWVARPGTSMHERGLAVDLGGDIDLAAQLVGSLGLPLHRPLAHEPWHFELLGPP